MTTSSSTGVAIANSTVLSVTCPDACSLALPGERWGPSRKITSGSAMIVATIQIVVKRRAWFGSSGAWPAVVGLDDIDEAVHVSEGLHRPTEAVDVAGGARHEALPAVATLLAGFEAEFDGAVSGAFARSEFTLVLGFFFNARQRHEHPELRHHERVRGFFRVDRVDGLAVHHLGAAHGALN